jgi:hypothetical protein
MFGAHEDARTLRNRQTTTSVHCDKCRFRA